MPTRAGGFLGAVPLGGAAILLLITFAASRTAWADAVVGTGTASSCTEAALNAALAGGGSITFNCGTSPVTIMVTRAIAADTSIDGAGLITLSGVLAVWNVTVTLANLSISTIFNDGGTLTVTNCTLSGNAGIGAIANHGGTVTVTNSTFSGNTSGGISNNTGGTLTVTNSTFSGNNGCSICNNSSSGNLTVIDSTFSGNTGGAR